MRKPNLFIPGFPKSGTSALHSALVGHPEISMGNTKEPHTYSWDNRFRKKDNFFKKNYKSLTSKYILDSSTSYMVSESALKRIVEDTPDAKFIIIARDPIDRIVSHYNWLSSLKLINKKPLEEINEHLNDKFNYKNHYRRNFKAYLDFSLYGEKMSFLSNLTSEKNIQFFTYEDVFSNHKKSLIILSNFLNLDLKSLEFKVTNKTSFKNKNNIVLPVNERIVNRVKNEYKRLVRFLNGDPKSLRVDNAIEYQTSREEIEDLVLPFLKEDIIKLKNLGYEIDTWETYKKIVN